MCKTLSVEPESHGDSTMTGVSSQVGSEPGPDEVGDDGGGKEDHDHEDEDENADDDVDEFM